MAAQGVRWGLSPELRADPEFQSTLVRLGVWVFGAIYITLAARTGYYRVDVPYFITLVSLFLAIHVAVFASFLVHRRWLFRRYLTLTLDIVAISLAIFITREAISPFYLLYIWIFISAGTRYGPRHLILASVEAVVAYSLVLFALDQWSRHTYEAVFFLLLLVLLPLYQFALLRELQRARDEAERANRAKGHFLAFMTHELRTPLTGVIGMTDLLKTTDLNGEQRDYVSAISTSARVLSGLIGDILDFSKIDAARLELERVPFEPRALVQEVCGVLGGVALTKGLELICEVAPEVPRSLVGDPLRVRQILFNLAGNAVKFTERGEVRVCLGVRPPEAGIATHHLLLEVEDTGIGIPADKLDSIFDSFRQADDSTTRRYGGSGLGTTIARELSRLMGGSIGVESVEGQGSRFWVRLPLLDPAASTVSAPCAAPGPLTGRRALIVEGNQTLRRVVRTALERAGVSCHEVEAPSGVAGLRAADLDLLVIGDRPEGLDLPATRRLLGEHLGECLGEGGGAPLPCLYLTYAMRRPPGMGEGELFLPKPVLAEDLTRAVGALLGLNPAPGSPPDAVEAIGGAAGPALAGIRVLVAEDNAIAAKVITAFLGKMGVAFTRVEDGEEALREALQGGYALAIVDLRMPKLDGLAFVRRYRARSRGRAIPIVALTANASEDVRRSCLDAGMVDFLAKPVSPDLLRQTIERWARVG